ncbi:MAG: hypothetical protein BM557_10575 [Flavobacterium sp. MedPE-SWcel]|uniref:DUF4291 domain-containing protein n=1 Tax=uncultured Flavobacterium sp. TaxID=165435 RepID=UPI00091D7B8F|nr:DUF4291 domain-containing protein [uncultured Flavobacterium sp.]OIQ15992.1 MAG: hypothetical protein BM557_10575 [Flavobacterium sp. MedPE-SWcel]
MKDYNDIMRGERVIRANYDDDTITVYQAFSKRIALPAVEAQTFVSPPFKMERMTWIKPSFLWMMYRSGWALKEDQKQILSIKITRAGFEEALRMSCLSTFNEGIHKTRDNWREQLTKSPVRIQWDPERDIFLEPLDYREIQIGLSGDGVEKYVNNWIVSIDNITEQVGDIYAQVKNDPEKAKLLLLEEEYYPVPEDIERIVRVKK